MRQYRRKGCYKVNKALYTMCIMNESSYNMSVMTITRISVDRI